MNDQSIREHVAKLLAWDDAHVGLDAAVADIPEPYRGKRAGAHSLWELVEHIRIAQWDILDFSRNENYKEMKWPEDYWPKENAPESEAAWNECIKQINEDQGTFIDLLHAHAGDLFKAIAHGSGQTLLRQALLIADHNSYHVGQIIVIRRLLGNWN